jgi:hypothetical protein
MSGGVLGLPGSVHHKECADVGMAQAAQKADIIAVDGQCRIGDQGVAIQPNLGETVMTLGIPIAFLSIPMLSNNSKEPTDDRAR